jgi:two-component system, OmpR family, sensor histidine kinase PhoQ
MPLFRSLRARVLLWVSVTLVVLFALTIAGLDAAFRSSSERALEELLQAQLLGLIALAEPDDSGELTLPDDALDPRFAAADSGLYAELRNEGGGVIWQSRSLLGRGLPLGDRPLAPGEAQYLRVRLADTAPLELLVMGIDWEFSSGRLGAYTIAIAASLEPYLTRQRAFRRNLIGWFGGITVTMLLVVIGLLTWVLRPLRTLARQVHEVEAGERSRLADRYPSELTGLAGALNALIDSEHRRLARYRNTLDDLAHSLKNPLAVMRTLLSESRHAGGDLDALHRELDRMDQRISYQLRRARASGATGLGIEPVAVAPLVKDIKDGLDKVYRGRHVQCALEADPRATFQGDRGDLTEIIGNLMDNAYKYCRGRVLVAARLEGARLVLIVADDGAGIGSAQIDAVLERGVRADESVPGQGIGLAVVRETVGLYGGTLSFARSKWGGAEVRVELGKASITS